MSATALFTIIIIIIMSCARSFLAEVFVIIKVLWRTANKSFGRQLNNIWLWPRQRDRLVVDIDGRINFGLVNFVNACDRSAYILMEGYKITKKTNIILYINFDTNTLYTYNILTGGCTRIGPYTGHTYTIYLRRYILQVHIYTLGRYICINIYILYVDKWYYIRGKRINVHRIIYAYP